MRQAQNERRRLAGNFPGIRADIDTGLRHRPAAIGSDVVADHAPFGGDEIACERTPHDAETDNPDGAFFSTCHSSVLLRLAAYPPVTCPSYWWLLTNMILPRASWSYLP